MLKSSCSTGGCLDAQVPIRISFTKLYQWPEADAEFLKLMNKNEATHGSPSSTSSSSRRYSCHESYVCRQRYLRSYTFTRKETVAERSKKWLKDQKRNVKKKSKDGRCGGCSCSGFGLIFFRFFISCMIKVDVQDQS